MRPGELQQKILEDHGTLRRMLEALESGAHRVLDGETPLIGPLRAQGEALCRQMLEHIEWEDANLAPLLASDDAEGASRRARLDRDHAEQRELMRYLVAGLQDQNRPPLVIARNLLDLARTLRRDMDDEEQSLRDAQLVGTPGATPSAPSPR